VPISVSQLKYVPMQGLVHARSVRQGVTLAKDVVRWVEDDTELACSWVAIVERLLHDTLALDS
jgi:hypothetical protein